MIRRCGPDELATVCAVINDGAGAYAGVIPPDCWHEPYMALADLQREVAAGVQFWGYAADRQLVGVMGLQDRGEVDLIRHAYVRTRYRGQGIGTRLLRHLQGLADKPVLVGTWLAATWAIRFYERNGYRVLSRAETDRLLRAYWSLPERQVETSVVQAGRGWPGPPGGG
jgi:GNAT superfamily N-acetyltransferase